MTSTVLNGSRRPHAVVALRGCGRRETWHGYTSDMHALCTHPLHHHATSCNSKHTVQASVEGEERVLAREWEQYIYALG
jgi:hypothetical protein